MDKKLAGLLGAAAALTTMTAAQASPAQTTELAPATSYSDLLDPIPNALTVLKAHDARLAETAPMEVAQVTIQVGHHHHHHRRSHHHHHHHHHHHQN